MEADGYFSDYPIAPSGQPLQPYQITAFEPAYDKDKYESTAWTLNGRFPDLFGSCGDLKAVYTGSYLVRHIEQQKDYSNYLTSGGGSYYACTGAGARRPRRHHQADHLLCAGRQLERHRHERLIRATRSG